MRRAARRASGRGQEAGTSCCGRASQGAPGCTARRPPGLQADPADWVILVTSLRPKDFATADVLALYRLRWRIELAFKRLKSLIGLKGPGGVVEFCLHCAGL